MQEPIITIITRYNGVTVTFVHCYTVSRRYEDNYCYYRSLLLFFVFYYYDRDEDGDNIVSGDRRGRQLFENLATFAIFFVHKGHE